MTIYIISDTHFNHGEKMVEFCGRPPNYDDLIYRNLSLLKSSDTLIHLGDICIGNDKEVHDILKICPTKMILVRGNHDKKSNTWYLNHGWDFVCESFENQYFGQRIRFTHKPMMDWEINPLNIWNIHGHLHNSAHHQHEYDLTPRHLLFALENENYKPVALERFLGRFKK